MAVFQVTNLNDSGPGSLRQAIADANANPFADTILIATSFPGEPRPINLTTGSILITDDVKIINSSFNGLQPITANGLSRIFVMSGGPEVELEGLDIRDGFANDFAGGGAIQGTGILTLIETMVRDSTSAAASGGAIRVSEVNAVNSSITGNSAAGSGGAISATGDVNLVNTTIDSNFASFMGGGISADRLFLENSSVTYNESLSGGGGISLFNGALVVAYNSVIAGNVSRNDPDIIRSGNGEGLVYSYHSFIGTDLALDINVESIIGGDPNLGTLGFHFFGGQTLGRIPLDGSPLIDAGSATYLFADRFDADGDFNTGELLPVDATGSPRIDGSAPDIGALERNFDVGITFTGTEGDDAIVATGFRDDLDGALGSDTVEAGGGDDVLRLSNRSTNDLDNFHGGAGRDYFAASLDGGVPVWIDLEYNGSEVWIRGSDSLESGTWRAVANLDSIENLVSFSNFDDIVRGDSNDNEFRWQGGRDEFNGRDGVDTVLFYFAPLDAIWVDLEYSGKWEAQTRGVGSTDLTSGAWRAVADLENIENVSGTPGGDILNGDSKDNTFFLGRSLRDVPDDRIDGRAGEDTVDYSNFGAAVWVDLEYNGSEVWTQDREDLSGPSESWRTIADLNNIENIVGSDRPDILRGDAGENILGYVGFSFRIGVEEMDGRGGTDTADFSRFESAVWVDLQYAGNEAWTQDDTDLAGGTWRTIANLESIENLVGTVGLDILRGDSAENTLGYVGTNENTGVDELNGRGGTDTADFSRFESAVWVDLEYAGNEAWTQDDTDLVGGTWRAIANLQSIESIVGTSSDDRLFGDAGANVLNGGIGSDELIGRNGNDFFQFDPGFGVDVVKDFQDTGTGFEDVLDFRNNDDVEGIGDVSVSYTGGNAVIETGDGTVVLEGISSGITSSDFLF